MKFSVLVVFGLIAVTCFAAEPKRKNLAGPPADFALHQLPVREQTGQTESSAEMWVKMVQDAQTGAVAKEVDLVVDSSSNFFFSIISTISEHLQLSLTSPSGKNVPLEGKKDSFPLSDDDYNSVPGISYIFSNPEVGTYKLTISLSSSAPTEVSDQVLTGDVPDAQVVVFNESPVKAFAYLNTFKLTPGQQVGLVSRITDQEVVAGTIPTASKDTVTYAEMDIVLPDGQEVDVPMQDDGLNFDEEANDGVYGATIKASAPGIYLATAVMKGKTASGVDFVRTTQHMINVISEDLALTGSAFTSEESEERVTVYFDVDAPSTNKWRVFAEVWGTDGSGDSVAVCWIGGMTNVGKVNSKNTVSAELDLKWIAMAKATAPFTLRNVYITDAESSIPVSEVSEIKLDVHTSAYVGLKRLLLSGNLPSEPTEEMKMGKRPPHLQFVNASEVTEYTLLSHGYCTGSNPFSKYDGWSNPLFFLNKDANNLNDEFALLLNKYAESQGATAFNGVGHSQGGVALLHLKNYYWSGLDATKNGRKIQSVGTPYQGSSAAGSAANLVKAFGVGCGENFDLSVDGATLWLSGITAEARSEVYYYTTTYVLGSWFGDWCNLLTNAVLEWPNDGVTELVYGQLPGGNNQGNTEAQCHTTDMGYEAQYYDNDRNAIMAQYAKN